MQAGRDSHTVKRPLPSTLVLSAENDPSTPPESGQAIADGIPGATFHVLPGARHLSNVEQPEAFTAALIEHLSG